jgi:hypothetical protein
VSSFRTIFIGLLVLFFNLFWVQRYTNSPGNIMWAYMFLTINWDNMPAFKQIGLSIGIAYLMISLITLMIHIAAALNGMSSTMKKMIKYWWVFAIIAMMAF